MLFIKKNDYPNIYIYIYIYDTTKNVIKMGMITKGF